MEKINIEIQKVKKENNKIEWTDTLELKYENEKPIFKDEHEKQQYIEEQKNVIEKQNNDELINTKIMSMEGNPFHQPSMNTLEFEDEESLLIVNLSKHNSTLEINVDEKIMALDKLYEEKIISEKEYNKKKAKILAGE